MCNESHALSLPGPIAKKELMNRDVLIGVGAGLNPPKYLVPGTKMDVQITQIGTLTNVVEFAK